MYYDPTGHEYFDGKVWKSSLPDTSMKGYYIRYNTEQSMSSSTKYAIDKIEDLAPKTGYTKLYIEEIKSTVYVHITNKKQEVTFSIGEKDQHETVSTIAKNAEKAGVTPVVVTNGGFAQMGDNKTEIHGALIVNGEELSTFQRVEGEDNKYRWLVGKANTFILWKDYSTEIKRITIDDIDYIKQNAQWAIGSGYTLVQNGEIKVTKNNKTEGNEWYSPSVNNPRTMFGVNNEGNFISVVVDGRGAGGSKGIKAYQQALIMKQLGAVNAVNFDGGGSSTFWYNGSTRNVPSGGSERRIGNVMMVIKKE
jgi:exopolysaccharide biosynthesis protein